MFKKEPEILHSLQFNVAQLLKDNSGSNRTYLLENIDLSNLDDALILLSPLSGTIKLVKTGHDILVMGNMKTVIELPCTRCLEPVNIPLILEIEEIFTSSVDIVSDTTLALAMDIDEATLIDEQHMLDLTEIVRQNLYLCQPTQVFCEADSQIGYRPQFRTEDEIDSRWAKLLALRDDFLT
ncbi:MAG: hypothetical protein B6242_07575 [Anaerolineaceae bacterium 4572_78]|nr:MAG: hypothetical protein B6242_07575 [Anaerolineaceae bacterium 4572_78]